MANVNKVILIGNLGRDPEIKYTPSGSAVANFSVAINESYIGKDGKKVEKTEWVKIVVWNKLAEACAEYLAKGRPVYVEGRIQTREWQDKEGVKRYTTEVVATAIQFLGGSKNESKEQSNKSTSSAAPAEADDSIPF